MIAAACARPKVRNMSQSFSHYIFFLSTVSNLFFSFLFSLLLTSSLLLSSFSLLLSLSSSLMHGRSCSSLTFANLPAELSRDFPIFQQCLLHLDIITSSQSWHHVSACFRPVRRPIHFCPIHRCLLRRYRSDSCDIHVTVTCSSSRPPSRLLTTISSRLHFFVAQV